MRAGRAVAFEEKLCVVFAEKTLAGVAHQERVAQAVVADGPLQMGEIRLDDVERKRDVAIDERR